MTYDEARTLRPGDLVFQVAGIVPTPARVVSVMTTDTREIRIRVPSGQTYVYTRSSLNHLRLPTAQELLTLEWPR